MGKNVITAGTTTRFTFTGVGDHDQLDFEVLNVP